MGRRRCVIIPIFLFSHLFQANQSVKGMMPTTFSKTYHKEKILNSKQYTVVWQLAHDPG